MRSGLLFSKVMNDEKDSSVVSEAMYLRCLWTTTNAATPRAPRPVVFLLDGCNAIFTRRVPLSTRRAILRTPLRTQRVIGVLSCFSIFMASVTKIHSEGGGGVGELLSDTFTAVDMGIVASSIFLLL